MMAPMILLLAIQNEDDRAFMTQIYLDYRKLMYAVALEIVRDPQAAEDMISTALTEMIEQIDTLKKINCCRLRSYIASIVRNDSLDYVRKRNRRQLFVFLPKDDGALHQVPAEGALEDDFIQNAELDRLRAGIKRLPEAERMLLTMKYMDGMDDRKIAGVLGIGKDSVRTYLSRARGHLRQFMTEGAEHE